MGLLRILNYALRLRNSFTKTPFRYGNAELTACPQAIVRVTVEFNGRVSHGYAADCLPPQWFDKSNENSYSRQIDSMCVAIVKSAELIGQDESFDNPLDLALALANAPPTESHENGLLASFGKSMLERSIIDACCRAEEASFGDLITRGILCDDRKITVVLESGVKVSTHVWNRDYRQPRIYVRHTVGMADKIWNDKKGVRPTSLQSQIQAGKLRYFKIKIANRGAEDVDRVEQIAQCIETEVGNNYGVTLDGNEQFECFEEFVELYAGIQAAPSLRNFCNNVIAIEQPVSRGHALQRKFLGGLRDFAAATPVIIDESDEQWSSFAQSVEYGYTGTSSKACKGVFKALYNRQLVEENNQALDEPEYLLTGEDLCCVGPVSLHADLSLVSFMGLEHVERNGHQYFNGLDYLPQGCYPEVLQTHPDLYKEQAGIPCLEIQGGSISLESVNRNAFGCGIVPPWESYLTPDKWEFATLNLQ
ncbi:MAG: hypothetical protein HN617_10240 [Planctomycetaceae bacterium]|jgi:hypothetical protein|nr:hypothetical protein [Planctomycetaceae bacterium]MBT4725090.1 hypothetical protein [Planctomycetaceae bacterium]MBT5124058.1 hypothetical protein [Planctomycetaceae bacterium]MBT5597599.1 hypothetical protein [Planctomycetaceae bacterium]MBT5884803.1 hypothetical protein [Planctomycetaceae bacterium]